MVCDWSKKKALLTGYTSHVNFLVSFSLSEYLIFTVVNFLDEQTESNMLCYIWWVGVQSPVEARYYHDFMEWV
jgi:hypothetical protein